MASRAGGARELMTPPPRPRVTPLGIVLGLVFLMAVILSLLVLFSRGWTLPLGVVLLARLAFVSKEAHLLGAGGDWKRLPIMYQLGLAMHTLLALALTAFGVYQFVG